MELKEPIYEIEAWNVTERAFSMDTNYRNETTFALANGYLGTRGTFEEGYDFSEEEGLEGNFINGFYESGHIRYGEWNYGFPQNSQTLLNLPNAKTVRLRIDGEQFDMRLGKCLSYQRSLHMDEGILIRDVIWEAPSGKQVRIRCERLVSMARKNLMAQCYEAEPLNFDGTVEFTSILDAKVENHTRKTNPLVDYGPFGRHLKTDALESEGESFFYQGTTKNSGLTMSCMALHKVAPAVDGGASDTEVSMDYEVEREEEQAVLLCRLPHVRRGQTVRLVKFIAYTSCRDITAKQQKSFLSNVLADAAELGYEELKKEQKAFLDSYWSRADVEVDGEEALLQGLRFNLFHIMQASGRDGKTGLGAKGISGEGYEGHYFWDTEMYVLPVFIYTDSSLAKPLLDYRYGTLPQARDRARVLGHPRGALYPWRTINGEEASTYYPLGTAQYHINADVAYAFKLYVEVTGDFDYLKERAAEVLVETARVWADVGCFVKSRGDCYCICKVTGPDEYNALVDNNFYTNLMARENIRDALWALDWLREREPEAWQNLIRRLEVTEPETDYWQRIVDNMYFPYDEERGVYLQDDGFMMRKPWDDSKIPQEKRHLLYENYHPLFIFRQRMAKQADAILGMFLHRNYFTKDELKRNYDFYQEVTLHHSSLSTCIFGMLAGRIGYGEEAYRYFRDSARMDLDDYHDNFYAGIHAANMAGTWQAVAIGFGGLNMDHGRLELDPVLPEEWKGYTFRIQIGSSRLSVSVSREEARVTLTGGGEICFCLCGQDKRLRKAGEYVAEKI